MSLGLVLPNVKRIRSVSKQIAIAICKEAVSAGLATKKIPTTPEKLEKYIDELMYYPYYPDLVQMKRY